MHTQNQLADQPNEEAEFNDDSVEARIQRLGFLCPRQIPNHLIAGPVYPLLAMPMHYVAWTVAIEADRNLDESILNDLFGVQTVRESLALGTEVSELPINPQDSATLRKYLVHRRPVDSIIYQFALDTIALYLDRVNPDVVEMAKTIVARTTVAIAHASGEGWFGSGAQATADQVKVINKIKDQLALNESPTAVVVFETLNTAVASS